MRESYPYTRSLLLRRSTTARSGTKAAARSSSGGEAYFPDATRETRDGLVDRRGQDAREADAQLGIARGIGIELRPGDERDARRERSVVQRRRAQARREAAPEIQPAGWTRKADRAGRHVALHCGDHLRAAARVLGADRSQVRVEGALPHQPRDGELHQVRRVRVEPL